MTDETDELHPPFNGPPSDPDSRHQEWDDDEDLYGDEMAAPAVARTRPPPKGLSRRERHEWRRLEVARMQRETEAAQQFVHQQRTGWSKGFIRNPPRGLGRKGRRAWLAAEHEATRAWWVQRRASEQDIDSRAAGVLIVVLLLGAGLFYLALFGPHRGDAGAASTAAAVAATFATPAARTSTEQTQTSASASAAAAATRLVVPGAGNQAAVSDAGMGPQPVAGHWQPTPAGGVTPIPAPTSVPVDPAAVILVPQPTGPATAAQLATPVGAVTAWLARTCPSRYSRPYGADVAAGRAVMTTAGWAAAQQQLTADATGPQLWRSAATARQIRTCGDLDVQRSTDAPTGGGVAFVEYTAHRVVTTPGSPDRVEQLAGARMVIRQGDGRWLVDRPVIGG